MVLTKQLGGYCLLKLSEVDARTTKQTEDWSLETARLVFRAISGCQSGEAAIEPGPSAVLANEGRAATAGVFYVTLPYNSSSLTSVYHPHSATITHRAYITRQDLARRDAAREGGGQKPCSSGKHKNRGCSLVQLARLRRTQSRQSSKSQEL